MEITLYNQNSYSYETSRDFPFLIYKFCLILLPYSYATKFIFGLGDITWIDPSLILGFLIYIYLAFTRNGFLLFGKNNIFNLFNILILVYFFTSIISVFFVYPESTFDYFREFSKFFFSFIFCYLTYFFAKPAHYRHEIYKTFCLSTLIQLCIAIYFLGVFGLGFPIWGAASDYILDYFARQTIWTFIPIPRPGGTFYESPPYGLFMLSAFYTSILFYREYKSRFAKFFVLIATVGVLSSLSDQILLAFLGSVLFLWFFEKKPTTHFFKPLIFILVISAATYFIMAIAIPHLAAKFQKLQGGNIYGSSIGERAFHASLSLELFVDNIKNTLLGIGPGMYGQYAGQTGVFPKTVTPQFTIFEILVETGVLGFFIMGLFLFFLVKEIFRLHGILGLSIAMGLIVGNSFQANWKWSGVFFITGLLLAFSLKNNQSISNETRNH